MLSHQGDIAVKMLSFLFFISCSNPDPISTVEEASLPQLYPATNHERAKGRHILIAYENAWKAPAEIKRSKSDSLALAENLHEQILQGLNFTTLSRQYSDDSTNHRSGELGIITRGKMVPEFEAAVIVLEPGKISQPVQTQFGWHVIALNDRRIQSLPSLEKLRPEIIQNLKQSRIEEIVELALQNAEIKRLNEKINPALIRSIGLLEK